ncbi:hypothetical protein F4054_14190 [Candidatus Poribacteria bacterium]|nr:hypothetical protein [Candidatus Poribacteria bacterium]MYG05719.1 hypothetical protein [Candidatus Poribacteria bacterium]MYK23397.1 hypothetical protein [Candidatus Poribacteria bacterium]
MRFQNLTITLTLACLSIVAIAGLVFLPITDGICEWTGNDSSKSYSKSDLDVHEQGWSLSASLSASGGGASASVSPSIHTVGVFTSEKTYSGSANVRAWRNAGKRITYYNCADYCSECSGSGGLGHPLVVDFEYDEDPESKTIFATVDMVTQYQVFGREKHSRTREYIGSTVSTTVGIDDYASATMGGEQYSWTENGVKYWEIRKQDRTNPESGPSEGVEASVRNWLARSGAGASFNFEDASDSSVDEVSTSNSVSYTP